jgi:hypothetical protein
VSCYDETGCSYSTTFLVVAKREIRQIGSMSFGIFDVKHGLPAYSCVICPKYGRTGWQDISYEMNYTSRFCLTEKQKSCTSPGDYDGTDALVCVKIYPSNGLPTVRELCKYASTSKALLVIEES